MRTSLLLAVLFAACAVGCEKKEDVPPVPTAPPTTPKPTPTAMSGNLLGVRVTASKLGGYTNEFA